MLKFIIKAFRRLGKSSCNANIPCDTAYNLYCTSSSVCACINSTYYMGVDKKCCKF